MRTSQAREVDAVQDQNRVQSQDPDPIRTRDLVRDHVPNQDLDRARDPTLKSDFLFSKLNRNTLMQQFKMRIILYLHTLDFKIS